MYQVFDYHPILKEFYITCVTDNADVAARWFKFQNPINPDGWKYLKVIK